MVACATSPDAERAAQTATLYWTGKASSGQTATVQVLDTTKVDDGKYRVKALVDGQQRVGHFNPESGTFDEGYYSLSVERGKKINELELENRKLKAQLKKAKADQND